jgi:phage anti-repressor protein
MKNYLNIFLILIIICSCNEQVKKNDLSELERIQIFQNKYISTPDTSFQIDENKILFLKREVAGNTIDNIVRLIFLEKIAIDWGELENKVVSEGYHYSLDSIDFIKIENQPYLYYEEYQPGGNLGNFDIEFTLYDISNSEKYFIHYTEVPQGSTYLTDFRKSQNLVGNETLMRFLEEKIGYSTRIYKPTNEDKLIRDFRIKNEKQLKEIANSFSIDKPIKFIPTTTSEIVFDINNIEPENGNKSRITNTVENDDFIVVSKFKGAVMGFNKSTKEYFCVWVPESMYDWINKMEFDLTGNLILYDRFDDKRNYLFNPYNSTYIRLK